MRLFDNDATASLTDRERKLLEMLGRCQHCLAHLAHPSYISGTDAASVDMRQRAYALQQEAFKPIAHDDVMRRAMYAGA